MTRCRAAVMAVVWLVVASVVTAACSGGQDRDSSFCDAVRDLAEAAGRGGVGVNVDGSMSEEETRARIEQFERELGDATRDAEAAVRAVREAAPEAIAADVHVVTDRHLSFIEGARSGDLPDASGTPETAAAFERVGRFTENECGVGYPAAAFEAPGPPAPPEPPAPPAPPAPPEPPSRP